MYLQILPATPKCVTNRMEITRFNTASAIALYLIIPEQSHRFLKNQHCTSHPINKKINAQYQNNFLSEINIFYQMPASTKGFRSSSRQIPANPNNQYPIKNRSVKNPSYLFFLFRHSKISHTCRNSQHCLIQNLP